MGSGQAWLIWSGYLFGWKRREDSAGLRLGVFSEIRMGQNLGGRGLSASRTRGVGIPAKGNHALMTASVQAVLQCRGSDFALKGV